MLGRIRFVQTGFGFKPKPVQVCLYTNFAILFWRGCFDNECNDITIHSVHKVALPIEP